MKRTHCSGSNVNAGKDTFWNLAVMVAGLLIWIASAVDLPQEARHVAHAGHQQTTMTR